MRDQAQRKPPYEPDDRRRTRRGKAGPARPARPAPSEKPAPARPGAPRHDPLAYQPLRIVPGGAAPARPGPRSGKGRTSGTGTRRRNRKRIPPAVLWNARFRALRNFLLLVLVVESAWLALNSPLLVVRRVTVAGAHIRTPREIVRVAALTHPGNIFRAPAGRAEKRLAALPEIASVHVERQLPRTLAVIVTERKPVASVQTKNGCWAMDRDGFVYRRLNRPLPGHPVLVAEPKGKVALGRPLPFTALPAALDCLAQLPEIPLARDVRLYVDASQLAWLNNPDGFKVRLGPLDNAPERLKVTGRILNGPDGAEIMRKAIALDMTTPNSEVYRPRQDSEDYRISGHS